MPTPAAPTALSPETRQAIAKAGLLNHDDAAGYLATSPRRIRELWQRRELAGVKVGRSVRFAPADLDAYIARHRVEAVA